MWTEASVTSQTFNLPTDLRDESHFNVSLIVRDKVTRPCPQTTTFQENGEPKWYRTEVLPLTSLPPYRKAKPALKQSDFVSIVLRTSLTFHPIIFHRPLYSVSMHRFNNRCFSGACGFRLTSVSLASVPVANASMAGCQSTCQQMIGCFATAPSGHATLPPFTHCLFIVTGDDSNPMATLDDCPGLCK